MNSQSVLKPIEFRKKSKSDHSIILDLDQTLVYCYEDEEMNELKNVGIFTKPEYFDIRKRIFKLTLDDVVEDKKGVGTKTELWCVIRPHVPEFLKFCFDHFKVVTVWSAGRRKYVEAIVDFLFRDLKRPHIIYTYDDCEKNNKSIIKPIKKMINNNHGLDKYMKLENTFSLDDTEYTFSITNKENGIHIPAYIPEATPEAIRKDDKALISLMNWLSQHKNCLCPDIRKLKKSHIFKY